MGKIRLGLVAKFIIVMTVLLILTISALSLFFINHERKAMVKALQERGLSLANNFSYNCEYGVLTVNISALSALATGVMSQPDVAYCIVEDLEGRALVYTGLKDGFILPTGVLKKAQESLIPLIQPIILFDENYFDISAPINTKIGKAIKGEEVFFQGEEQAAAIVKKIGVVHIGLSLRSTAILVRKAQQGSALISITIILISALIIILWIRITLAPIQKLVLATQEIAKGDFAYRVKIKSYDELGELGQALNKMAGDLHKITVSRDELVNEITERKKVEESLQSAYNQLKNTQAQLIQSSKMAAIGQLSAGVAHEINNPLAGILGYAQFMLTKIENPGFNPEDFPTCVGYLRHIERESQRCKQIVENLLTFSRKSGVKLEPLDIKSILEVTLSILRHPIELQNIKITTDYPAAVPLVDGIATQLQQVFTNLILNAQQAMSMGGELNISVKVAEEKNNLAISFQDTGCGIPKENLERIFEPFFTTKQGPKSLGLGLTICYEIIQQHKGKISISSEVGRGSTFTILLPLREA